MVMTVRLHLLGGGLPLYAEEWMINGSNFESGVIPFPQDTLKEGYQVKCLLFTEIVVQYMNWEIPWMAAVTPEDIRTACSESLPL